MYVRDALADALIDNDVTTIFGVPGKQSLPLHAAIDDRPALRFVTARSELSASHQAWGYAETSGRMAVSLVVPGPGDMHAMSGLQNASNDCTPLLHISTETDPAERGGDAIHETDPSTYDTVVKENITVATPSGVPAAVQRAIDVARSHPRGPVRIGIPTPFFDVDVARTATQSSRVAHSPTIEDDTIDHAIDVLRSATSPVIIAGGGVRASGASEELVTVAELLDAPVVTTYKGKGTIPADHRLAAGTLGLGASIAVLDLLADADTALAIGTDFDAVAFGGWDIEVPDRLVHVTMEPNHLGRGYEPAVSVVADAGTVLTSIRSGLSNGAGHRTNSGADRAKQAREVTAEKLNGIIGGDAPPVTSVTALRALREAIPRSGIVTLGGAGGFRVWSHVAFPAYGPRRFVDTGSWASMGSGVPSGIGAALANPDAEVVTITGDGELLLNLGELHTLAAEDIPLTVAVLNNNDYAVISDAAEADGGAGFGWGDAPADFVTVAEGLGIHGTRAESQVEITEAMSACIDHDGPALLEIPTDPAEPQASEWMR